MYSQTISVFLRFPTTGTDSGCVMKMGTLCDLACDPWFYSAYHTFHSSKHSLCDLWTGSSKNLSSHPDKHRTLNIENFELNYLNLTIELSFNLTLSWERVKIWKLFYLIYFRRLKKITNYNLYPSAFFLVFYQKLCRSILHLIMSFL